MVSMFEYNNFQMALQIYLPIRALILFLLLRMLLFRLKMNNVLLHSCLLTYMDLSYITNPFNFSLFYIIVELKVLAYSLDGSVFRRDQSQRNICEWKPLNIWIFHSSFFT